MARGSRQPLRPVGSEAAPLAAVRALATELLAAPWFAACGEPLTEGERADLRRYLAELDLPASPVADVASWSDAAAITKRTDWSQDWWAAEERAARALQERASASLGEAALLAALSEVTEAATSLHGHAALACARAGIADPALSRVAAGAAALACHQMGLVRAAGAGEDHPLAIKYRLSAGGRWLLGVIGESCYLF